MGTLKIEPKSDNYDKLQKIREGAISKDEIITADEFNKVVNAVDLLLEKQPITSFNYKGTVTTYSSLPSSAKLNDGFGVLADGLVYVWNGASFQTEGNGIDLGLKPFGKVKEGDSMAVSGGEVFNFSNKELSYVNLSYNKDTEGIIIFNSKSEARTSTPNGVRKRGLVITYNLNGNGWITEQYIGSSANWLETDSAFVDVSVSRVLNGQLRTYEGIEYNEVTKVLKFNSGVLSVSDGRRINTALTELTMINGFSRIILRGNSIVSVPIDERLDVNPKNSNLLPTDINIGVVSVSNTGIEVFNGSGFNVLSNRPLLLNNQRLSLVNNLSTHINFNLSNRKLIITGGSVIDVVTNGRYNFPETTLDMLNTIPNAKVIYDIKTNTISVSNQTAPPANDTLILFTYIYTGLKSTFVVNGIQNYLINGVNETFVAKNEEIAYISISNRGNVDFQTTRRKIVFTNVFIIDNNGTRITVPNMEADMPTGMSLGVVYYDKINNIIKVRNQTGLSEPNSLMLFNYHYSGIPGEILVQGLNNYSLNGVPNNRLDYRRTELKAMDNFEVPFFNVIQQNGVGTNDDFDLYNITSSALYNMYDNAIGGKSGVTKTLLGATESENPINIYKYNIKFRNSRMPNRVKPKIAIVGGTHAGERIGLYSTYQFFNYLINNPENNAMVEILRNNFDWVFIPCNNPYSIDVGQVNGNSSVRWNHNGVDINRNYDWNWESYSDDVIGSQYYKGTAPFSEKESQIVRDCLISELDNLFLVVDTHNFGGSASPEYVDVWYSCSQRNVFNICSSLSDRITFEIRKRYELSENNIVAYADYGLSLPTVAAWVNNVLNINALTLETSQSSVYKEDGYMYDGDVITRSLTAYVNSFYSIAKECLAFENDRIIGLP